MENYHLLYIVMPFKALCPFQQNNHSQHRSGMIQMQLLDQQKKPQLCQENDCGYDGLTICVCVCMCVFVYQCMHVCILCSIVCVCVSVCLCV